LHSNPVGIAKGGHQIQALRFNDLVQPPRAAFGIEAKIAWVG
jgi:hypothetical protein